MNERLGCVLSDEFVAHGANVNCVALGHKTGRVMVTGGDDRKVNLWTVGKPNCVMVRPTQVLKRHTTVINSYARPYIIGAICYRWIHVNSAWLSFIVNFESGQ